eukprot:scaffold145285_cov41-Prasinocladus_malaysianus.AAC.1
MLVNLIDTRCHTGVVNAIIVRNCGCWGLHHHKRQQTAASPEDCEPRSAPVACTVVEGFPGRPGRLAQVVHRAGGR